MSSCSINTAVESISSSISSMESAINGLAADAEKGITASLASLSSTIDSAVSSVTAEVNAVIPAVEEVYTNLQTEIEKLFTLTSDALALEQQIQYINDTFDDVVDDLDSLMDDAIAAISGGESFDVCALIPNIDVDSSGNAVQMGKAGTIASVNADVESSPPEVIPLEEVVQTVIPTTVIETPDVVKAQTVQLPSKAITTDAWLTWYIDKQNIEIHEEEVEAYVRMIEVPEEGRAIPISEDVIALSNIVGNKDTQWSENALSNHNEKISSMESSTGNQVKVSHITGTIPKTMSFASCPGYQTETEWSSVTQTEFQADPLYDKPQSTFVPGDCLSITVPDYSFQLSDNYILRDLTLTPAVSKNKYVISQHGLSVGEIICNLQALAENVLEPIRSQYGNFTVTSGFRHGSSGSQHQKGQAVDIQFTGISYAESVERAKWIISNMNYDQFIFEHKNNPVYHFSWNIDGNRSESASNKFGTLAPNSNTNFAWRELKVYSNYG